jgi:ABC-type multidrug transport system ATPase subunit/ABC-type multidrug transport system permease subunit
MRFVLQTPIQFVAVSGERMAIGRDQTNDVVLEDPNVSRFHAEVTTGPHGLSIRDLGSRNGTRVDGVPVRTARLRVGSEIGVGPFRLIFDGASLVSRDDRGALRLDAEKVAMSVRGKAILQDTTLSIAPGEFVAIIGESGSGKTTLLKALAGVTQPTGGTVTVNGDPVGSRRFEIGYVPQDEIVHPLLTVREALRYAAKLRLPADASGDEVEQAVRRVLDELALEAHAETRIGSLSGGQRKRAGVGTELVNRPGLLFLDEATTGLDPVLERRMMELMRDLADNGRAVITITHATKNLSLCDKIVVMGRGGLMCFVGSLPDALKFFKASDADGIYAALDATEAKVWRARWLAHSPELTGTDTPASEPAPPPPMPSDRPLGRQASILAGRYVRVFLRDRKNMAILLGQVPILALFVTLLWPSTVFHHAAHNPGSATIVLFLLVTLAIWFGCVDAAREIIKERAVFVRESAVGVRTGAYLASKFTVLTALASVQTLALGAGVLAVMHLDQAAADYAALMVVLVLTSWVGVALGLTISVLAGTENQATSFIPLVLIPQLLFAGQLVPLRELPPPARVVSDVVPTRWSFAAEGRIIDLNGRYAATPATRAAGAHYGQHFFALSLPLAVVVLGAFVAVLLSAVTMRLRQIAAS